MDDDVTQRRSAEGIEGLADACRRFSIGYHGREASKAERIGKKYQWIAYHEMIALVADHFQYRERFRQDDGDQAYDGPWQDHLRDIDPSCTLRASRGGISWPGMRTGEILAGCGSG